MLDDAARPDGSRDAFTDDAVVFDTTLEAMGSSDAGIRGHDATEGDAPNAESGDAEEAGGATCSAYCNTIFAACVGLNQQYYSIPACLNSCAAWPRGTNGAGTGNTMECHAKHADDAVGDPATQCMSAGPTGGDVCGTHCESFCTIALAACTGAHQVYPTMAACLEQCAGFPTSPAYSAAVQSGNSFACRTYHLTLAAIDPDHCPHLPAPSPVCF